MAAKQKTQRAAGDSTHLRPPVNSGRFSVSRGFIEDALASETARPLASRDRAAFGLRLGFDFAEVRIHSGERAAFSAALLNADAFSVGSHVVLGDRRGACGDDRRWLLAHELVHVMQHGAADAALPERVEVSSPTDAHEREASAVADRATRGEPLGFGEPPHVAHLTSPMVSCNGAPDDLLIMKVKQNPRAVMAYYKTIKDPGQRTLFVQRLAKAGMVRELLSSLPQDEDKVRDWWIQDLLYRLHRVETYEMLGGRVTEEQAKGQAAFSRNVPNPNAQDPYKEPPELSSEKSATLEEDTKALVDEVIVYAKTGKGITLTKDQFVFRMQDNYPAAATIQGQRAKILIGNRFLEWINGRKASAGYTAGMDFAVAICLHESTGHPNYGDEVGIDLFRDVQRKTNLPSPSRMWFQYGYPEEELYSVIKAYRADPREAEVMRVRLEDLKETWNEELLVPFLHGFSARIAADPSIPQATVEAFAKAIRGVMKADAARILP